MMEEIPQMIQDCQDRDSKLSDWEINFIESIENWYASRGSLSPAQAERLEIIWDKVTAHG